MTKLPTIFALSGPPRSGKDTSASILKELLESVPKFTERMGTKYGTSIGLHRMSRPLKDLAAAMLYEKKWASEELKDTPFRLIDNSLDTPTGITYRNMQIELYHLGAYLLGPDWLGHHYLRTVHACRYLDYILMPDAGRPEEIQVLLDHEIPLVHFHIQRNGTSYSGDSREFFTLPEEIPTFTIRNNGSLEELRDQLLDALELLKILPVRA